MHYNAVFVSTLMTLPNLFTVGTASPVFERQASQSTQDSAIQYLQTINKIAWHPVKDGHYAEIPDEIYNLALTVTGQGTNTTNTLGRRGKPNDGSINGYSVTKTACYHKGSLATDNDITQYAVSACDALVGSALPPLVPKVVRIWQSAQSNDVNGLASYIRYGAKLLTQTTVADTSLCQAAMDAFDNYCQAKNKNGDSYGGELTVGGVVTFSADPTDLENNH